MSARAGLFRQLTPLVLAGVLAVVVLEPWLPGAAWLNQQLGAGFVLRAALAVLAFYVLLQWSEMLRMHSLMTGVLQALREFEAGRQKPKNRLEVARVLIGALSSNDTAVRATSRHNLQRLAGKDLGEDAAAWSQWLAEQERADAAGS